MSYRFNRVIGPLFKLAAAISATSMIVACSSAAVEEEPSPEQSSAAVSTCGGALSGSFSTLNAYYTYSAQSLNVGCAAAGATLSVSVAANDVPNRFTILDASGNTAAISGWLGNATYSGLWGSSLSNAGTATLSFNNTNGPYSLRVETQTPPNSSYPHTTDEWNASASCQCVASATYSCGYAMSGNGCDNGRTHVDITATDMTAAIAACKGMRPSGYPDFCYVLDRDPATPSDASECALQGSWRPVKACCNFVGALSCPN